MHAPLPPTRTYRDLTIPSDDPTNLPIDEPTPSTVQLLSALDAPTELIGATLASVPWEHAFRGLPAASPFQSAVRASRRIEWENEPIFAEMIRGIATDPDTAHKLADRLVDNGMINSDHEHAQIANLHSPLPAPQLPTAEPTITATVTDDESDDAEADTSDE